MSLLAPSLALIKGQQVSGVWCVICRDTWSITCCHTWHLLPYKSLHQCCLVIIVHLHFSYKVLLPFTFSFHHQCSHFIFGHNSFTCFTIFLCFTRLQAPVSIYFKLFIFLCVGTGLLGDALNSDVRELVITSLHLYGNQSSQSWMYKRQETLVSKNFIGFSLNEKHPIVLQNSHYCILQASVASATHADVVYDC